MVNPTPVQRLVKASIHFTQLQEQVPFEGSEAGHMQVSSAYHFALHRTNSDRLKWLIHCYRVLGIFSAWQSRRNTRSLSSHRSTMSLVALSKAPHKHFLIQLLQRSTLLSAMCFWRKHDWKFEIFPLYTPQRWLNVKRCHEFCSRHFHVSVYRHSSLTTGSARVLQHLLHTDDGTMNFHSFPPAVPWQNSISTSPWVAPGWRTGPSLGGWGRRGVLLCCHVPQHLFRSGPHGQRHLS